MNPEAQLNIGKTIQELITQKKVDLVALEGAFGPMDFSWYRHYPYQDSVRAVADYLLKEKRISGPVHTAFTLRLRSGQALPPFVGVDEKKHYDANVAAVCQSASLAPTYKKKIEQITRDLNETKNRIFNPILKNFDQQMEAYRTGSISWGEHARFLSKQNSSPSSHNGEARRGIDNYLSALELEEKLNFSQVEHERTELIAHLIQKLSKTETNALLIQSAAFRAGELTPSDFYTELKNLCEKKSVSLTRTPAMNDYIRYVLLADSLDVDGILKESAAIEKKNYSALCRTEEERGLVEKSRWAYLTGKLLDFALSKEEWEEYKSEKFQVPSTKFQANSKKKIPNGLKFGNWDLSGIWNLDLGIFEKFYEEAEARDRAMAANLEKTMTESHARVAILVTGGFHSEGLIHQLQPKGFTVVSYVPKISKIEDEKGTAYLSVFTQEKTPLEKLFAGEKLFLAPLQEAAIRSGAVAFGVVALDLLKQGESAELNQHAQDYLKQLMGKKVGVSLTAKSEGPDTVQLNITLKKPDESEKQVQLRLTKAGNKIVNINEKAVKNLADTLSEKLTTYQKFMIRLAAWLTKHHLLVCSVVPWLEYPLFAGLSVRDETYEADRLALLALHLSPVGSPAEFAGEVAKAALRVVGLEGMALKEMTAVGASVRSANIFAHRLYNRHINDQIPI